MTPSHFRFATAFLTVLIMISAPAGAAPYDEKAFSPTKCVPVGPGTTIDELTYNSFGVFNPGVTNETVLCSIMTEADAPWQTVQAGTSATLVVYFRAGAVSGKVACTAYTGSTVTSAVATYATSFNAIYQAAGTRSSVSMLLGEASGTYDVAPPLNLMCTLTPKAALGSMVLVEFVQSNNP